MEEKAKLVPCRGELRLDLEHLKYYDVHQTPVMTKDKKWGTNDVKTLNVGKTLLNIIDYLETSGARRNV